MKKLYTFRFVLMVLLWMTMSVEALGFKRIEPNNSAAADGQSKFSSGVL